MLLLWMPLFTLVFGRSMLKLASQIQFNLKTSEHFRRRGVIKGVGAKL